MRTRLLVISLCLLVGACTAEFIKRNMVSPEQKTMSKTEACINGMKFFIFYDSPEKLKYSKLQKDNIGNPIPCKIKWL